MVRVISLLDLENCKEKLQQRKTVLEYSKEYTGEIDRRMDVSASVVWVKSGKGRVAPVYSREILEAPAPIRCRVT